MKEARFVLPSSSPFVMSLVHSVNKYFSGSTIYNGVGYWKMERELITVIDIAYEPTMENDALLFDIANDFRHDAHQESVYLRYGNGNVQMVTVKSCMDNGELEPFEWDRLREDIHKAPDDPNDCVEHAEHVQI